MSAIRREFALLATLAALLGINTLATAQTAPESAPAIIPTDSKLDIDPTETIPIEGWWSNGTQVLHIEKTRAFQWWEQPNRFRAPNKVGRCDRQNYRTIWLQPYADPKDPRAMPARIRAPLRRTDGVVRLDVGESLGLLHLDSAPPAPEDLYVGMWTGPGGSLELAEDGRYELRAARAPSLQADLLSNASHSGVWALEGQLMFLFRRHLE